MKYEYTTIQWEYTNDTVTHPPNEPDAKEGWIRVWADISLEGCFAVYRRIKK